MSSGDPIPYAEALPVAEQLRDLLAPDCERVVIAGSLRRRKALVSDIELVAEARYREEASGLWGDAVRVDVLAERVDVLRESGVLSARPVMLHRADGSEELQTRDGPAYKALTFRGLPVDLFVVDPSRSDFGVILTIRTGPADFSRELVTRCRAWGRRVQGGRLYAHGQYVPCPDERTFLAAVGMPWLEPEERAPERVKLMMAGSP